MQPSPAPSPTETPELAAAWRELQRFWLATVPGYRELLRESINEAARAREKRTRRIEIKLGVESRWPKYQPIAGAERQPIKPSDVRRGLRELLDTALAEPDDVEDAFGGSR